MFENKRTLANKSNVSLLTYNICVKLKPLKNTTEVVTLIYLFKLVDHQSGRGNQYSLLLQQE